MEHHVFQQVQQHLFDQGGLHGDQKDVLGLMDLDGDTASGLAEFGDGAAHDLLHHLFRQLELDPVRTELGDGEDVLRHAHQPLGILVDLQEQVPAGGLVQVLGLQQRGGGAQNGGEGGTDVVGDGPEQIGAHTLALDLVHQPLLVLDLCGKGADDDRDQQHNGEGEGIAGQGHIKDPEGIGEHIVDTYHADHRGGDAADVPVREAGDGGDAQDEDGDRKGVVVVVQMGKGIADHDTQRQDGEQNGRVPAHGRTDQRLHMVSPPEGKSGESSAAPV